MPHAGLLQLKTGALQVDASTLTLLAAMSDRPTNVEIVAIDTLIRALKQCGAWGALDIFYAAGHTEQAWTLNWKNPATFTLLPVGAPPYAVNHGPVFNGTSTYYRTQWTPSSSAVNYLVSSCSIGWFGNNNVALTASDVGSVGTGRCTLIARSNGGQYIPQINVIGTGGTAVGTSDDSRGIMIATRSGTAVAVSKDGNANVASYTAASTALSTREVFLGASNDSVVGSFSPRSPFAAFLGGFLNPVQEWAVSRALTAYFLAINNLFVSSVAFNDIPVGNDSNLGSINLPLLTVTAAITAAVDNQKILVNSDGSTDYRAASIYNVTKPLTIDAVDDQYYPTLSATTTTNRVMIVNPGAGMTVNLGAINVDARGLNTVGIEVSASATATWFLNLQGTAINNPTTYGVSSTVADNWCLVRATAPRFTPASVRSCFYMPFLRSGAGLILDGREGQFDCAPDLSGVGILANLNGSEAGAVGEIRYVNADIVTSPDLIGVGPVGVSVTNLRGFKLLGNPDEYNVLSLDSTQSPAVTQTLIRIQPTNDGDALDTGGFEIAYYDFHCSIEASCSAILIGHEGTQTGDPANNLINGGVIHHIRVFGDAATAAFAMHAFANGSYSETEVYEFEVRKVGIGALSNEAAFDYHDGYIEDCTSSYVYGKGSLTGSRWDNVRTKSTLGYSGVHMKFSPDDITLDEAFGEVTSCSFLNDSALNVRLVDIVSADIAGNITRTNNNYYSRVPLHSGGGFRVNGVDMDFTTYQATYEPSATWSDPGY